VRRRSFLAAPIAASLSPAPLAALDGEQRIHASGDGIPHTPAEYSQLLNRLTVSGELQADNFSRGGVVEKLELRIAAMLGKEVAVWLPTGTLANQLAVRLLAGPRRRVLVQAESHLYNDCGDCAQTLSGLTLIPLARGQATFTLVDVERASSDAQLGRVAAPIGAIQIETPVRRRSGERFSAQEMARVTAWAKERRIGLHLDGARLFIEAAYTGTPVAGYAAMFDTVYVSMYKCFNAGSGAILAGPKSLLADLYHTRRMFGGGLPQSWPFAAVALHYLNGFEQSFRQAKQTSEIVIEALSADSSFAVERVPNGTNIFRMRAQQVNAPIYQQRLESAGISAGMPVQEWFELRVNPTWSRVPATEIVARFRKALG
jgi:threonine aldolase